MLKDEVHWDNGYGAVRTGYYYGKNGAATYTKTGWQKIGGQWFYFMRDGRPMCGWINSGKKTYYIDDEKGLLTGTHAIDGQLYTFNKDGVLTAQIVKQNGWYEAENGWYYFEGGSLVSNGERLIGGKIYFFYDGKMQANCIYGSRYLNKNGQYVTNTWKKLNGYWFYFGADGYRVTGEQTIGGKKYLFDSAGILVE